MSIREILMLVQQNWAKTDTNSFPCIDNNSEAGDLLQSATAMLSFELHPPLCQTQHMKLANLQHRK